MNKILIAIVASCILISGCAPANITAVNWPSGTNGENIQTRCERVDMRNQSEMEEVFSRYDGWKLVYLSEYTTENKVGTDAAVCFERVKNSK
jgi:hypothetical protein